MSFLLELVVERLTPEQARAVEVESRARSTWPIRASRQRRFLDRVRPGAGRLELRIPDKDDNGDDLLSHRAEWDAPAWAMEPKALPSFAEAIRVLGEELFQGCSGRGRGVLAALAGHRSAGRVLTAHRRAARTHPGLRGPAVHRADPAATGMRRRALRCDGDTACG